MNPAPTDIPRRRRRVGPIAARSVIYCAVEDGAVSWFPMPDGSVELVLRGAAGRRAFAGLARVVGVA